MVCYEYTKKIKSIGKFYIYISVIGAPLTIYFTSNYSESLFAIGAKYILLAMFAILLIFGLVYIFLKKEWFFKITDSYFEYVTPFRKSRCFKVPISEIEKLEIQDCNSPDTVYYYLHMKNAKKYRLDTESLVSMRKIEKCLTKYSIEIEYSASI